MQRGLSKAVITLRARQHWTQDDLANELRKCGSRLKAEVTPDQGTISRWERCEQAPSPTHRMVLARIATKYEHEDLAELFRAPVHSWRLVGHFMLGLGDQDQQTERKEK
jgi:transcriptional regulator with XRE-family HTH domain